MFIFSFDLRKPKFQVLVNNLAGVILCRLSKRLRL